MNQDYIYVNQLTKSYVDPTSNVKLQALRGIDLKIEKGTFTSIIGPSGAGKSTLLNILGGMIPPSTGSVIVDGTPLHTLTELGLEYYRKRTVGFLWQLPERNLLPGLSAFDNVMFAMRTSNYPVSKREKRANDLLDGFGLEDRKSHSLSELSGGEAQRASLAVALANDPDILFADEPTGELDSHTTMEVIKYLRELSGETGLTIVVVTHDDRFERSCEKAYHILDGTIANLKQVLGEQDMTDWRTVQREELNVVNQFGMIRIPDRLREKYGIKDHIRFVENEEDMRLYIEPVKPAELNGGGGA